MALHGSWIATCLYVFNVTFAALTLLFHIGGIYLISKLKTFNNRNKVLLNLSTCEVFMICFRAPNMVAYALYNNPSEHQVSKTSHNISTLITTPAYVYIMMGLSLDPLAMVILGINYKRKVSSKLTIIYLSLCWVLAIVPGLLMNSLIYQEELSEVAIKIFIPFLSGLFLVQTITAYVVIISTMVKQRRRMIEANESYNVNFRTRKIKIKTPILIIATFILFIAVPTWIHSNLEQSIEIDLLVGACYSMGLASDAVIYIYYNAALKEEFARVKSQLICNLCHKKDIVSERLPRRNGLRIETEHC